MEIALLCIVFSGVITFFLFFSSRRPKLPPGPPAFPIVGNLFWLCRSSQLLKLGTFISDLRSNYGPIFTLRIGSVPSIFITDGFLAHKALVEHGAIFSGRPAIHPAARFISSNQNTISAASYGPVWRILRRSIISEVFHPSRVRLFANGRRWVLETLIDHLRAQSEANEGVVDPMESFQFAMFCLLVLMCFGEKLDKKAIREIEITQRNYLLQVGIISILPIMPTIAGFLFRKRLKTVAELRRKQKEMFAPLIRARREGKKKMKHQNEKSLNSYVDSLLEIDLPEDGGRHLCDDELVALCSEFLSAGTDTTSTSLQWIMAELVKNQEIQLKLWEDIQGVVGIQTEINEEDLQKIPYLKAVIMEGLRLHPPGHSLLPHTVTEDTIFEGYLIPRNTIVMFMVKKMAMDPQTWENSSQFSPERFMVGGSAAGVDITGIREIRMMPFGAGRRICPGLGLAMLHLEYFVAALLMEFEWRKVEGDEVDLSERLEFTVVMRNPLRARLAPRRRIEA